MTQPKNLSWFVAVMAIASCASIAGAQAPPVPLQDADYAASGYVTPAGMVPPSMYRGGVMPIGMAQPPMNQGGYQGGVMPVGFLSGGGSSCDGGCDGACGSAGYGGEQGSGIFDSGLCGGGGLCGGLCGGGGCGLCGGGGCGSCGKSCLSKLSRMCPFCRGSGCSACKSMKFVGLKQMFGLCKPDGELCGLRWYDLSVEAVFLGYNGGAPNTPLTSFGIRNPGPSPAPIVLGLGDADGGNDLEAGVRLSGALIWGPGGNIEATYMGGNKWNDSATVSDPNAGLYSFISDFGINPPGGFDDTDRSLSQRVSVESRFHSVELNYRRRTMGPYCRFQGSWLVGLRYVQFSNDLDYSTLGTLNNGGAGLRRFFSSNDEIKNELFGPQAGFDMWWNIVGGVNLGWGMKGAWVQNDVSRRTVLSANSINTGATPGSVTLNNSNRSGTVMGDFEFKFVWQFNHSWKFRTAYYAVVADDIAFGSVDRTTIRDFVQVNSSIRDPAFRFDSLTVQGVSFGTEYTW